MSATRIAIGALALVTCLLAATLCATFAAKRVVADDMDSGDGSGGVLTARERITRSSGAFDAVDRMLHASDGQFDAMSDGDTSYSSGGEFNWRYFETSSGPGKGVVVFDFFIPTEKSEPFAGDDRFFPGVGYGPFNFEPEKSRIRVVIDRREGRGIVVQNDTEGLWHTEEPRPIVINDDSLWASDPDDLDGGDQPNVFQIGSGSDSISLQYDALNSISAGSIDVQGGMELAFDGEQWSVNDKWGDDYPAIGVYHYEPTGGVQQVAEYDQEGAFCGAFVGLEDYC